MNELIFGYMQVGEKFIVKDERDFECDLLIKTSYLIEVENCIRIHDGEKIHIDIKQKVLKIKI